MVAKENAILHSQSTPLCINLFIYSARHTRLAALHWVSPALLYLLLLLKCGMARLCQQLLLLGCERMCGYLQLTIIKFKPAIILIQFCLYFNHLWFATTACLQVWRLGCDLRQRCWFFGFQSATQIIECHIRRTGFLSPPLWGLRTTARNQRVSPGVP